MQYRLEVSLVLRHFVKGRMRPVDLFLVRPSDRHICKSAPADGLLSPPCIHFELPVYPQRHLSQTVS